VSECHAPAHGCQNCWFSIFRTWKKQTKFSSMVNTAAGLSNSPQ